MNQLADIYASLDPFLIVPFRLAQPAWLGFALGIAWLCLLTTLIGEVTMYLVWLLNRGSLGEFKSQMVQNHNLSLRALAAKDKASYKACNDMANEFFGRSFFAGAALFAASLWPTPFVMGWLSQRFQMVDFSVPLVGEVSPVFFFLPAYVLTRVVFALLKPRLPLFSRWAKAMSAAGGDERLLTLKDLREGPRESA